jgi:hypothetical protein
MRLKFFIGILLLSMLAMSSSTCVHQSTPFVIYSMPELKYLLISNFNNIFYVDPDFYPIARAGQEEKNALEQFPAINANNVEFAAILKHLGLSNKNEYTNEEKLLIYREHKIITLAVELTTSGNAYSFILRVGEGQGERIEGTITSSGNMKILKREPIFNTYPICLAKGTLIDTPSGQVPIEELNEGMDIWTVDNTGNRISAVVGKTAVTPVSSSFQMVMITLDDGRTITASPGHPTADGRAIGEYMVGDSIDGVLVIAIGYIIYNGGATYDFLPEGSTGLYWANGIQLKSTLVTK